MSANQVASTLVAYRAGYRRSQETAALKDKLVRCEANAVRAYIWRQNYASRGNSVNMRMYVRTSARAVPDMVALENPVLLVVAPGAVIVVSKSEE